ncbi:MAG: LysR family transcriptional regulator [Synechococcales cyanobacterium RM1_1_8]|nr:LysR family transcriptional regulator [Synechococcales cyanobacterium RM1_1_8]
MNISALKILIAVVEAGSFSEAALKLEVSQSAVSRAIASLEKEWGISLLSRGRFGAQLTPVGERLLEPVREILQLDQRIVNEINLTKGLNGGRVRIASFRSAATHLLPAKIAQFSQRYPNIEVQLTEADPNTIETLVKSGKVDLGLVPLPRSAEFETWEIADDEFVVLLPPTQQAIPPQLTWEALSRYAFILYSYAECTTVVQEHWSRWGKSLKVAYEIKEDSTIVSMVAQGLGAAVLPKLAALPIPEQVEVRSLPVPLNRRIGVAVLADQLHPPAVFAFLDLLRGTGLFAFH